MKKPNKTIIEITNYKVESYNKEITRLMLQALFKDKKEKRLN